MSKIKKLPIEVYEKIKAGEVIEDPASVVRELLDNSIDAQATEILIEVEEGGISRILIEDNGCGMNREDLLLSFEQHTTSKISHFEDIFKLSTAGFRGEALASIARVSFLVMISSDVESGVGHAVFLEGGKVIREVPAPRSRGTSVEVKNLFFNVPVRQKNIKSPVRELRKIKEEIITRALAFPDIAFTLKVNKNISFSYSPASWEERIKDIFKDFSDKLIPFYQRSQNLSIKGAMTQLNTTFNTSENLYFFVNNKAVRPRFLFGVINSVFSSLIPRGRYPGGVVYLYTDPANIDPNIHPSKKEIKIFIEDQIYRQLFGALRKLYFASSETGTESQNPMERFQSGMEKEILQKTSGKQIQIQPGFDFNNPVENFEKEGIQKTETEFKYIGICFDTFLIAEKEEELYFIDFHAANERKRYEELKIKAQKIETQTLLTPKILTLNPVAVSRLSENKEQIKETGFSFYFFGEDSVVINGIPSFYGDQSWEEDFKDLMASLDKKNVNAADLKEDLLKSMACKGSYRSGESINPIEAKLLIQKIFNEKMPLTCPHGRPFIYSMAKKELSSKFLRG